VRKYFAAAMLWCLVFSCLAFSQGGNSQLGGVVTDPSGALMPGVTVTVTNVETSITNTSISNESGSYNFPSLQPGTKYTVSASLPGFQKKTVTSLVIGTAVNVRQDFQMQIASTTTTVEVSIEANELLTTNSQSVGEMLSASKVRDLPIVGNDVLSLLKVLPGVRGGAGAVATTMAGVGGDSINTVRDGLSVSDGRFESGVFSTTFINPDLVGEIKVILAPVDAEMGRGNGQVIISTRSGTNKYSGTAQWDIRNTALNPNTWNNNRNVGLDGAWSPTVPNWSNTHHVSVSYGGPIVKNKTFFFALWDQQLQYQRNTITASVMTDAARNGIFRYYTGWNNGNTGTATLFTGANPIISVVDAGGNPLRPQFNPGSATANVPYTGSLNCISVFGGFKADGSAVTAADCPGGTLVAGTWDPLRPTMDSTGYIAKIMAKMPKANYFGTGDGLNQAGYRFTRTRRGNSGAAVTIGTDTNTNRKQFNLKVDQNFTPNHKLSASWSDEHNASANDEPNWPGGIPYQTLRYPQILTTSLTSTLSSSLLNEARFGLRYSNANIAAPIEKKFYPDASVVDEALKYTIPVNGYDVMVSPGAGAYAFGGTLNGIFNTAPGQYNGNISKNYTYADTFSWTRGKHAFKFGGEWRATDSNGYNNIPQLPFPRILGGPGANASNLGTAANTPLLPAAALLGTNRANAVNMLYFLAGSIGTSAASAGATQLYWIAGADDVKNGTWQDTKSLGRKFRDTIENEASVFYKDDWKISKNLTLNLGLRWDWYGAPYIGSGFTSTAVSQGAGLFGVGRDGTADLFDNWLRPNGIFLSGYGPNATTGGLQCTTGVSNGANLPASSCDPSKLTTVEFVGPGTPNPNKSAYPSDYNNFGPAVGFSYNTNFLGENRSTTFRGGYQITYGGSGRLVGGGGATSNEVIEGGAPGPLSTANTQASDFGNRYMDLRDVPLLVPVRPTNPVKPGGTIDFSAGTAAFSAVDPHFVTPYVQNFTMSMTSNLTRKVSMDLRYIGTVSKKQQSSINPNTQNVFFNQELWDALSITRAGGDAPLFDQMLVGLNINNGTTGYGPVGTCVVQAAGSTASGLGKEGCAANAVMQHGSAALRRNATFSTNIANGNFSGVAGSLLANSGTLPANGTTGGETILPTVNGVQVLALNRRLLRNGCDRIAAGLSTPVQARCFPEDYLTINPQIGLGTFVTNGNSSNYHSLQTQFTLRPTAGISWQGTYTFSKNLGISGAATDPTNRNGDYTITNNDVTHEFRTNGTFELPLGPNKLLFGNSSGWLARAIERWQTSVIFNYTSGVASDIAAATMFYANGEPDIVGPFPAQKGSVRWDAPNNTAQTLHGGTYFGQPSPLVSVDDPQCARIQTDTMGFNLNANGNCTINALALANPDGTAGPMVFQQPLPGHRGTLGQNVMRLPGIWNFDANLSKTFRLTESKNVQLRIDTTNVLNHPDAGTAVGLTPNLSLNGTTPFGSIGTKGNNTRTFQGTLRFQF